jgi:hypothetical protein
MHRYRGRWSIVAAALLVSATILFAVGTSVERSAASTEQRQRASTQGHAGESSQGEAGEHDEGSEGGSNTTNEVAEQHPAADGSGEELLGINPESAGLTAATVVVSLLLVAIMVARPGKAPLLAMMAVGLVFAALDAREVIHQASESHPGLFLLALVTGLLHLGVAVAAAVGLRAPTAVPTTT